MEMRRLTAGLLGTAIALIIIGLCVNTWGNDLAFTYSNDKTAMIAVTVLIIIGLVCLIVVFILDVVMLCQNAIPAGMMTARFVLLYIGAALILTAILVYTAKAHIAWSYFLIVIGMVFSILVAILAAVYSRCVSSERVVVVRSAR